MDLKLCIYNHAPPPSAEMESRDLTYTIDEKTPRLTAGWTILYDFIEAGVEGNPVWFSSVYILVSDYEDYYFEIMEDVVILFDSLSTTSRSKLDTVDVWEDIVDFLLEIEEEYFDTAHACAELIPDANWLAYAGTSVR